MCKVNADTIQSRQTAFVISLSAMLNSCTIIGSDWESGISWCAFSSVVPQADGPVKEQPSVGIANDSTHQLYKDH